LINLKKHLQNSTQLKADLKNFELIPYNVKLKSTWHTASTKFIYRQGILVKLIMNDSSFSIGECAPMEEIGTESLAQAQNFLAQKLASMLNKKIEAIVLDDAHSYPASRFALESAILSLLVQKNKEPLAHYLNPGFSNIIKVNAMLGHLSDDIVKNAQQAESIGFHCLKIKMGMKPIETEVDNIKALLKTLSTSTRLRLDANKSWTVKQTQWLLDNLEPYKNQIDCIEEPLKDFNQRHYQELQQQTVIPLALDESFIPSDFLSSSEQHLTQYPVKKLVLKPMAQGGILNTLTLARLAEQAKIKTIITSSIETGHGLWPITHLCAAINNNEYHGLSTASWLEDTLIKPPEIHHGIIRL